jgi:hypothetical protein
MPKPKPFTVYLAGPMSGIDGYNFNEFHSAAASLREHGIVVISPAETAGGVKHLPREMYFRYDFSVINVVDAVVVLPVWELSRGATAEVVHATEISVPVYEYHATRGLGRQVHITGWKVHFRNGPWAKMDELGIVMSPDPVHNFPLEEDDA